MAQIRFQSKENKAGAFCRRKDHIFYALRSQRKGKSNAEVDAASMLTKLGLCAAACALVFVMNTREEQQYKENAENERETEKTEEPGTLKFVEIPGLLSVFSPEEKYALPLASFEAEFKEEDRLLCLRAKETQSVCAAEGGLVTQAEETGDGWSICVQNADGRLWRYSGLQSLRVENGQSLSARDTLGDIAANSVLFIRCEDKGKAMDLKKMLALDKRL